MKGNSGCVIDMMMKKINKYECFGANSHVQWWFVSTPFIGDDITIKGNLSYASYKAREQIPYDSHYFISKDSVYYNSQKGFFEVESENEIIRKGKKEIKGYYHP